MAIIIKGTGGLDTPSINATANAVFTGPVDFTQAVLKGVNKWQVVGSDTNLQSNRNYFANTRSASLTLTLPTSANVGDTIVVQDSEGFASSNNITINRNGNLIDGSARNAILNVDRGGIALTFESATNGFVTRKEQQESQSGSFQGEVSGYASGGSPGNKDTIDKFPFAVDTNATDVGNLSEARSRPSGQSSSSFGYNSGGREPKKTTIDKFPFAVDTNATDVGDLTQARNASGGQSSSTNGYVSGGFDTPSSIVNTIDKFPFSTDTNASDVGNLTQSRSDTAGQSSSTNGYVSGGNNTSGTYYNTIDKFPFSTDTNASDVGNLTQVRGSTSGQSSREHGYTSGGSDPATTPAPGSINTIDKFPFATDTNATDVGDLSQARNSLAGQSSLISGYVSGGYTAPPGGTQNTIDKFPFVSDSNATDVGDLTQGRYGPVGQQV